MIKISKWSENIDLAKKGISKKLMIFGSDWKKQEFRCSVDKDRVWKKSGVTTQGRRKVEVGTLLLGNEKNVIKLFLVFKLQVWSIHHTFHD